jgi:hypothetical protein
MRRQTIYTLILALLLAALLPGPAQAQAPVTESWAEHRFGDHITFYAKLESDVPVETAVLFFQAVNDPHTNVGLAQVKATETGQYLLQYTHNLADYALRAYSPVDYYWLITLEGGAQSKSQEYQFYYEDNRFAWNTLANDNFTVHWYEGDVAFAQSVLDLAREGLLKAQNLLSLGTPSNLKIYVYPDSKTLQSALTPNAQGWIAGHADPDLNVIVVALPPGPDQTMLMEQRIPHELMHILLYQATDLGYDNLPTWLSEGLASLIELYPNSDYRFVLENASQKDSLIPLGSLCETFPRDASSALLSYAEAASFTDYLHGIYGTTGLQKLVTTYANGLDCEHGAQKALGKGLAQLEREWQRDKLAKNVAASALNNLLPWIILLFFFLLAPLIWFIYRLRAATRHQPSEGRAS